MQTFIVTDNPLYWVFLEQFVPIITAADYLANRQYHPTHSVRIINLCSSYHYQSIGYYVSLLAQARDHKTLPSAHHIQDTLSPRLSKDISHDIHEEIQKTFESLKENSFILSLYFGKNMNKQYDGIARKLHGLFPLPLIQFRFEKKKKWGIQKITLLKPADISGQHLTFMQEAAERFLLKKRFHSWKKKQRYHDLAILIDPHEKNPPSNAKALELFASAGETMGLNVEFIDKHHSKSIAEFDALYIRATTSLDHFTYRFARRAAQENMVVIDDPQSIVKCTNKVYLAELLQHHHIPTPTTCFISKYDTTLPPLNFPLVLKIPDGAFSKGVIKVDNLRMLEKALTTFFKTSDLVLIQSFIPTAFDWRICIIDNKPLCACRYYMAKDHWQIYNWDSLDEIEGEFDTVPLEHVPQNVLKTALKATRLIGNGLYGVDIKTYHNHHYVIEINDNPNIDANIEDQVLGKELYETIMSVFLTRIRKRHGYV